MKMKMQFSLLKVSISNIVILSIYILLMVFIAYISRKKSKTLSDFFSGGRGIGGWMSAFSYGTTYFSAVIFIGYAGKLGWQLGLSAVWIGVFNAIFGSLLAWVVLAARTRGFSRILNTRTMPEFFEKRYSDSKLKLFSSLVIFVFLIPYSSSVYQGLGYIFETVYGVSFIWCIVIMATVTSIYVFLGGYFATSLSDFFQGIIMIFGVLMMIIFVYKAPQVNFTEGISKLINSGYGFISSTKGGLKSNTLLLSTIVLLTSFGIWAMPQSIHKFHAIRDKKSINQASIISTIFCFIIGFGAYIVGGTGRLFLSKIPQGGIDELMPHILTKTLPGALMGLIVVLVLSASMSTLASLSLAGASSFAIDAYKGFLKKDASDKNTTIILRISTVIFILISAILAILKLSAIVSLMSLAWGVLAGCFIGPYLLGLYFKKINKYGCYASIIFSLLLTIVLVFVFGKVNSPNNATVGEIVSNGISYSPYIGVLTMIQSMIITPLVSIITSKKVDSKNAIELFESYRKFTKEGK